RLNHWLPRAQAHPEVMQGTADLHHHIADALLPEADPIFHHATALHATVDMLDAEPTLVQGLVRLLLLQGQLRTAWLLHRHENLHLRECERQEAQILQQPPPSRERVGPTGGKLRYPARSSNALSQLALDARIKHRK